MFRQRFNKVLTTGLLLTVLSLSFLFGLTTQVYAIATTPAISVNDEGASWWLQSLWEQASGYNTAKTAQDTLLHKTLPKIGEEVLSNVLSTALKQMAYDSANWLATGAKGQGPQFLTQGWGPYLNNIGDAVAGGLIEGTVKELAAGAGIKNFSLCNPSSFEVAVKIGLGLRNQERPNMPTCTFSKIKANVDKFANDKHFLSTMQGMFDPTSNDIGIALSINSTIMDQKTKSEAAAAQQRTENKGWLSTANENIGETLNKYTPNNLLSRARSSMNDKDANGKTGYQTSYDAIDASNNAANVAYDNQTSAAYDAYSTAYDSASTDAEREAANSAYDQSLNQISSPPGFFEQTFAQGWGTMGSNLVARGQDALVDAANVFLNQLALKSFQEAMKNLGKKDQGAGIKAYGGNYGADLLTNVNAPAYNPGIAGAQRQNAQILEANFNVRGDYDLLSKLTICTDPNNAGPTDCVLDDKFRQAIQEKKTVRQAIKEGYLSNDRIFGFLSTDAEPKVNEGIPYRNMLILRKYGILPVGWEVAAQYINQNFGGTVQNAMTLKDLVNCFPTTGQWCSGLVDPDWVLKAPQQYCAKEGFGGAISLTTTDNNGKVTVSRAKDYCADEQSCIKEKVDGSCDMYGYCAENTRTWNFGESSKSCEAAYNTCKAFTNTKDKSSVAYLENTLDYSNCDASVVGCASYCGDVSFDAATKKYTYNCSASSATAPNSEAAGRFFFDDNAKTCTAANEGCHQFIRTKAGIGANLLLNSDFSNPAVQPEFSALGIISGADGYNSTSSLGLNNGLYTTKPKVGIDVYGQTLTLSFYSKGCGTNDKYKFTSEGDFVGMATATDWALNTHTYTFLNHSQQTGLDSEASIDWSVGTLALGCKIDNIKLEFGLEGTGYSNYAERGSVFEKFVPGYLAASCTGASTDPAECANFARKCTAPEVGCELYTSKTDQSQLPAKVVADDYCVGECTGYKQYMQSMTVFDSLRDTYFIPKTATKCDAAATGCDQFTNLDKATAGGEAVEYYSYLRQCIKPDAAKCGNYYTWQGSAETGMKLVTESLEKGIDPTKPAVTTADDVNVCSEAIYNLSPADPQYNPDCMQFYDKDGNVSYHLHAKTITCNDDCHPYRRTAVNTDPFFDTQMTTDSAGKNCDQQTNVDGKRSGYWDVDQGECLSCINNGEMVGATDATAQKYCVYNAVPSEGQACAANQNGCREYVGSQGENMRNLFTDTFSNGIGAWQSTGVVATNTENLRRGVGSLKVSGLNYVAYRKIGEALIPGKTYVVSFLAKAANNLMVYTNKNSTTLGTPDVIDMITASTLTGSEWKQYSLSFIASSSYQYAGDEFLVIDNGSSDFYLDNIKLTEVTDRFYLINDSWKTPATCDQDLLGNASLHYMLNCDQYADRDGLTHYLRHFNSLCADSGVGCELMIDTHNSTSPDSSTVQGVTTSADNYIYAVYDKSKLCGADQKGCQRLGLQHVYGGSEVTNEEKFVVNNPDSYTTGMCTSNNVGCNKYTGSDGSENYFKNPFDNVCEYRAAEGSTAAAWYKRKVKRCQNGAAAASICTTDADCVVGAATSSCAVIAGDTLCQNDWGHAKTFGTGGLPVLVQPYPDGANVNWVGTCAADSDGCTEIIDPLGKQSGNLIANSNFSDLDNNVNTIDIWSPSIPGNPSYTQSISLDARTMYYIGGTGNGTLSFAGNPTCAAWIFKINNDNKMAGSSGVSVDLNTSAVTGADFFVGYNGGNSINCDLTWTGATANAKLVLRKASVDYKIMNGLDDKSCHGEVNISDGCMLFNERATAGGFGNTLAYKNSIFDANPFSDGAIGAAAPSAYGAAGNNGNVVLKVTPDRKCSKWLSCSAKVAYTDDNGVAKNYCSDVVMCDSLKSDGSCNHVAKSSENRDVVPMPVHDNSTFLNYTGYTKVGLDAANNVQMTGFYALDHMDQVGSFIDVPNGDFEVYSEQTGTKAGAAGATEKTKSYKPASWNFVSNTNTAWNSSMFDVVQDAVTAQNDGVRYPINNRAVMRVGAAFEIVSSAINIPSIGDYYLTFNVNTKNLNTGKMKVEIVNGTQDTATVYGTAEVEAGLDWSKRWVTFNSIGNAHPAHTVYIKLSTVAGTVGKYYLDNFDIKPVLNISNTNSADPVNNKFNRAPECRLYPEADSLSCSYRKDSGLKAKGLYGYCLEYDRAPGNPNVCLLWWPGERIQGDSVAGEDASVQVNGPLFYCAEARPLVPVVKMKKRGNDVGFQTGWDQRCTGYTNKCAEIGANGYSTVNVVDTWGRDYCNCSHGGCCWSGHHSDPCQGRWYCVANGVMVKENNTTSPDDYAWYLYTDGIPQEIASIGLPAGQFSFYDRESDRILAQSEVDRIAKCEKIVRTVTESGDNKAWSDRVGGNSKYMVGQGFADANQRLYYGYKTDVSPFGSMLTPNALDPYGWNGTEGAPDAAFRNPIFVKNFLDPADKLKKVNGGAPYQLIDTTFTGKVQAGSPINTSKTDTWTSCVAVGTPADPNGTLYLDPTPDDGVDNTPYSGFNINGTYSAGSLPSPAGPIASTSLLNSLGILKNCNGDSTLGAIYQPQSVSSTTNCYCGPITKGNATQNAASNYIMVQSHSVTYNQPTISTTSADATMSFSNAFGRCVVDTATESWSDDFTASASGWFNSGSVAATYDAANKALKVDDAEKAVYKKVLAIPGKTYLVTFSAKDGGYLQVYLHKGLVFSGAANVVFAGGHVTSAAVKNTYSVILNIPSTADIQDDAYLFFDGANGAGNFTLDDIKFTGVDYQSSSFKMCITADPTGLQTELTAGAGTPNIQSRLLCIAPETCVPFPNAVSWQDSMQNIYARNYGVYKFNWVTKHYELEDSASSPADYWPAPTQTCPVGTPDDDSRINCGFLPILSHINVNYAASTTDLVIHRSGFANLTFNSEINKEQRPMMMIDVLWGEGSEDKQVNAYVSDRQDPAHPHLFSRLFDYWTTKALMGTAGTSITCATDGNGDFCSIRPEVNIKDNWDFESGFQHSSNIIKIYAN